MKKHTEKLTAQEAVADAELSAQITYVIAEDYVIGQPSYVFKIGCTKNEHSLARRLQNLQTGNFRKLSIVHTWSRSDHPDSGFALEQAILLAFDKQRIVPDQEWIKDVSLDQIKHFVSTGKL